MRNARWSIHTNQHVEGYKSCCLLFLFTKKKERGTAPLPDSFLLAESSVDSTRSLVSYKCVPRSFRRVFITPGVSESFDRAGAFAVNEAVIVKTTDHVPVIISSSTYGIRARLEWIR